LLFFSEYFSFPDFGSSSCSGSFAAYFKMGCAASRIFFCGAKLFVEIFGEERYNIA
jgi:hypothetical protein